MVGSGGEMEWKERKEKVKILMYWRKIYRNETHQKSTIWRHKVTFFTSTTVRARWLLGGTTSCVEG